MPFVSCSYRHHDEDPHCCKTRAVSEGKTKYQRSLSYNQDKVQATEASLLETLGFNPGSRAYAYAEMIFDELEKPAGMALYFHNYSTWASAPGIYLEDLFVYSQYRNRGYGKALFARLAELVLELPNGQRLDWSVLKWNEPSIKFYENSIKAVAQSEWQGMRLEGREKLEELAKQRRG